MKNRLSVLFAVVFWLTISFAEIREVLIIPFSHLDIGFTATQKEVSERYVTMFENLLDVLEKFPDFSFTVESFWQFQQWLKENKSEEKIQKIRTYVQESRLEFMANFANMHTGFQNALTLHETVAFPMRELEKLGIKVYTCIQNDVPGFSADFPDILFNLGIRYLMIGLNDAYANTLALPGYSHVFYWEGPRGGKVLTYVTKGSYMEGMLFRSASALEQFVNELEQSGYKHSVLPLLTGFDNAGYEPGVMALIKLARTRYEKLNVIVSTPSTFFEKLEKDNANSFPTYKGDWSGWWEIVKTGCPYSSANVRWVQDSLEDLLNKEIISTSDPHYDAIIEKLLLFMEHSSSCGAGWPGILTFIQTEVSNKTVVCYAKDAYDLLSEFLRSKISQEQDKIPIFCRSNEPINARIKIPIQTHQGDLLAIVEVNNQNFEAWSFFEPSVNAYEPFTEGLTAYVTLKPGLNYLKIKESRNCNFPKSNTRVVENDFYRIELSEELTFDIFDKELGVLVMKNAGIIKYGFTVREKEKYPLVLTATNVTETIYPAEKTLEINLEDGSIIKNIRITLPFNRKGILFDYFVDRSNLPYVPYVYHSANYFVTFSLMDAQNVSYRGPSTIVNNPFEFPSIRPDEISVNGFIMAQTSSYSCVIASREAFMVEMKNEEEKTLNINFHLLRHYSETATRDSGVMRLWSAEPETPDILRFSFFFSSSENLDMSLVNDFLRPSIVIVSSDQGGESW